MTMRRGRTAAGTVLAALAIVAVPACSSGAGDQAPPPSAAPSAAPAAPAAGQPTDAQRAAFGQAHQGALALVALGGLGTDQGVGDQVKGLAPDLTTQGQALDAQVRAQATAAGVVLGDQLGAQQQAVVADLQARSGPPFDQAWLRAALDMEQQARAAATAILDDPVASPEAKQAARDALATLDALRAKLQAASATAGAGTPSSVNTGTGGQAADDDVLPVALLGIGALLLAGAGLWRRRRSA
jgi:predicted outer membrane protein